ncbi:MAG: DEAD/DEAH box helicase family protein, partial [Syntrophales bacterium]|nr:DEAD/DEAH box helicase family protein [Syntrophales bacterium]
MLELRSFQNKALVLKVSPNYDHKRLDPNKYEAVLDALCGEREYQKNAIRSTLFYFLGNNYKNLTELAEENYHSNISLQTLYGTLDQFKKHLQIHNKLCCSLDLATGTGKSYVIYGIARIMLAEGVVDHVLVVCPSTTIEDGLMEKFKQLSGDDALRNLLPDN